MAGAVTIATNAEPYAGSAGMFVDNKPNPGFIAFSKLIRDQDLRPELLEARASRPQRTI